MSRIVKRSQLVSTLAFGISAVLFFGIFYKYHLLYIEGMQSFFFTWDYCSSILFSPGGVTEFVSRFLIQFFHIPLFGGVIIAICLISPQLSLYKLCKTISSENDKLYPLTFIPAIYYWVLLCYDNYTIVGLLALSAAVCAATLYAKVENRWGRTVFGALAAPLLWYLIGGAASVTIVLIIITELISDKKRSPFPIIATAVTTAATIILAKFVAPWFNPANLFFGGVYYQYAGVPLKHFIILYLSTILIGTALPLIPKIRPKWSFFALLVLIFGIGGWQIAKNYDCNIEDNLFYLFNARGGNWSEIISHSKKKKPNSLLSLNTLNLALAKENLSGELFFAYPRTGQETLVLSEDMDMLFSGEVLFNLGFINEAQRYAFEDMVTIPDRQRGAYFLTRIAETNMIAGREGVAKKYLDLLHKTIFYRKWADARLELIATENGIDNDPYFGPLRRMQPEKDFYFNTKNFDKIIAGHFEENPLNKFVYNYLMMNLMLKRDIPSFCNNFTIFDSSPIPRLYQEVLLLACKMSNTDPFSLPYNLSRKTAASLETFLEKYKVQDFKYLEKHFKNTFWYYLYMVK